MNLPKRLLSLFRRNQLDAEMAEEMRLHLELQEERNRAAGMNAEEARYAAQRQFGNVGSIQEVARDGWGWRGVEGLIKDLRFAFRHLQKTPAFTLMAVLTLALGIGLSTAAFSLLNVIWLRPLPFEDSGNLMRLRRSTAENPDGSFAPADMLELKRSEKPFGRFAGYADQEVSLAEPGRPAELKPARRISADYFAVLGVRPESGRTFSSREEVYGRHRVAVLSHAFWKSRYGAADAIGRTVRVDGEAVEIIGVLPAWASDARVIRDTALFLPLAFTAKELAARDNRWVGIIGRRSASLN